MKKEYADYLKNMYNVDVNLMSDEDLTKLLKDIIYENKKKIEQLENEIYELSGE